MSQNLAQSMTEPLVVAITARALFDLEKENNIYEKSGLDAYRDYQLKNVDLLSLTSIQVLFGKSHKMLLVLDQSIQNKNQINHQQKNKSLQFLKYDLKDEIAFLFSASPDYQV